MLCEEATQKRYRFRHCTLVQNADENISSALIQQQIYSVKEQMEMLNLGNSMLPLFISIFQYNIILIRHHTLDVVYRQSDSTIYELTKVFHRVTAMNS